jgi:ABC-type amino acid transport substrate-binding protein
MLLAFLLRMIGVDDSAQQALIRDRQPLLKPTTGSVLRERPQPEVLPPDPNRSAWDRIRTTGRLRVGYEPGNLPFSYFNSSQVLVGLDIELAHLLAEDLNCELEFVPFHDDTLAEQLSGGEFDIAMSGVTITPLRLLSMRFSVPYLETSLAFVVPDHRREDYQARATLEQTQGLRLAVGCSPYHAQQLQHFLPHDEVEVIGSPREFFEADHGRYDALVIDAESGSAWTILYPRFEVVIPRPDLIKLPVGFAVGPREADLANFLDRWIAVKRGEPRFDRLLRYWIKGDDAGTLPPRWSVLRNVLGWVD